MNTCHNKIAGMFGMSEPYKVHFDTIAVVSVPDWTLEYVEKYHKDRFLNREELERLGQRCKEDYDDVTLIDELHDWIFQVLKENPALEYAKFIRAYGK